MFLILLSRKSRVVPGMEMQRRRFLQVPTGNPIELEVREE